MTGLFDKPIHQVAGQEISELIQSAWPESYTLEFKRSLPHKNGGTDAWDQGKGSIGEFARDEILAEVVGLANSDGGFVILGIEETREKPPRASAILAQKNVRDLATRFEDAARVCIDPPISMLTIHPIEMEGKNGVVVFKVNASRHAPHRIVGTRECYLRRGTSNVKMTMREMQDMAVISARRSDDLEKEFKKYQTQFATWPRATDAAAYRVTAVPLDRLPDPGRLYRSVGFPNFNLKMFRATIADHKIDLVLTAGSWSERPILRGIEGSAETHSGRFRIQQFQSGVIELCFATQAVKPGDSLRDRSWFYHGWLLGGVANVLRMVAEHRQRVGFRDAEYGVQVEIVRQLADPIYFETKYVLIGGDAYGSGVNPFPVGPILLPVVSVGSEQEFDDVINTIDVDVLDALGNKSGLSEPMKVQW